MLTAVGNMLLWKYEYATLMCCPTLTKLVRQKPDIFPLYKFSD